jgi:hypothetical protein
MGNRQELVKLEANRRGWMSLWSALATVGGTAALIGAGAPLLAAAFAVGGGVLTAQRAWKWLRFRGEWGLRF